MNNLPLGVIESRDIDYKPTCDRCLEVTEDLEGGELNGLCVECRMEEDKNNQITD
jgi:hypothetical protein